MACYAVVLHPIYNLMYNIFLEFLEFYASKVEELIIMLITISHSETNIVDLTQYLVDS